MDFIEPAQTERASPTVFVLLKGRTLRFCVVYRKLNAVTIRDLYSIPHIDKCINSVGDAMIFSRLDASSLCRHGKVVEEDWDEPVFPCNSRLSLSTRMPFRSKNATGTFQRAMEVLLTKVRWQFALVLIINIVILSCTPNEHIDHVGQLLTLL